MRKERVLITGGNKGIGLACTKLFLENGFEVFLVARDFDNLSLNSEKKVNKIEFDLRNIKEIVNLYKDTGPIDVLVNNAGIMNSLPFDEYPEEKKKDILKVNLEAPIELIKLYSKYMIKHGSGRIVSVASIAGHIGHPDIWYGITKAGVINMTKSFAKILGPKGITINCTAPGPVDTDMLTTIPKERKESLKKAAILGRIAKPEEIAKTIYWLGVESPDYINGVCIDVNNGMFMR